MQKSGENIDSALLEAESVGTNSPCTFPERPDWLPCPLVPVAIAFAAGIVVDNTGWVSFSCWLISAIICLAGCGLGRRSLPHSPRCRTALVLLACFTTGGAWHDARWWLIPENSLLQYVPEEDSDIDGVRIVELGGVLAENITVETTPSSFGRKPFVRSSAVLEAETLLLPEGTRSVSGRVLVQVDAAIPRVLPGARLRCIGQLEGISGPANPGEFDVAEWRRTQGIQATLRVKSAGAVEVVGRSWRPRFLMAMVRGALQQRAEAGLNACVSPDRQGLTLSLLLGRRGQLDPQLRETFLESGMMHVLAVSGMNVSLVAGLVYVLVRGWTRGPWLAPILVGTALVGFLMLTDADPPVMRATIIGGALLAASVRRTPVSMPNLLALAALIILLIDPHDALHFGAQLSFLAVAAMSAVFAWEQQREEQDNPEFLPVTIRQSWIQWLRQLFLVTFAIWIVTAPAIAAQTGLVTPVSLLLNLVSVPLIALLMWSGYLTLFLSLIAAPLGLAASGIYELCLKGLVALLGRAVEIPGSHLLLPPIPGWWVAGLYLIATGLLLCPRRWHRGLSLGLGAWLLALVMMLIAPHRPEGLRMTVFSVGHGLAILLELPGGEAVLYDAGSLGQDQRAARTILQGMRARRVSRLAGVFLSHADADHFNAMPWLLSRISIGWVAVTPQTAESHDDALQAVLAAVKRQGIPLRLVSHPAALPLAPGVTTEVLHPPESFHGTDNAESLVLLVTLAGRTLLLTGDLEGAGLTSVMGKWPRPVNVLLAPHHGGKRSNTNSLAGVWKPDYVLSSQGRQDSLGTLRKSYGSSKSVWATSRSGAITVEITPSGEMTVTPFKPVSDILHMPVRHD